MLSKEAHSIAAQPEYKQQARLKLPSQLEEANKLSKMNVYTSVWHEENNSHWKNYVAVHAFSTTKNQSKLEKHFCKKVKKSLLDEHAAMFDKLPTKRQSDRHNAVVLLLKVKDNFRVGKDERLYASVIEKVIKKRILT